MQQNDSLADGYIQEALLTAIDAAAKSLDVMIYQITGPYLVTKLVALAKAGVKVRLLVSSSIYGAADCKLANAAYNQIKAAAGGTVRVTDGETAGI